MYYPRLYKYRDSYVLYIPKVHAFDSLLLKHTLLVQTHIHYVSAPWEYTRIKELYTRTPNSDIRILCTVHCGRNVNKPSALTEVEGKGLQL